MDRIRTIAQKWLKEGSIDYFLGYVKRPDGASHPARIHSVQEVNSLVFDNGCFHNLAAFLPSKTEKTKVGVILKGCDGRAFVQLIAEQRVNREHIKILGIVCPGLKSENKLLDKCKQCGVNTPPVYDELIGDEGDKNVEHASDYPELVEFEKSSDEERLEFFKQAFSKCIRCYACRQVCPMCYCDECMTEKSTPQWIETSIKPSSNLFFHLMRAYHLAGRCVECGECSRVCPLNLPLDLLRKKLSQVSLELFDYQPGIDPEQKPPLITFDLEDSDAML